MKLAGITTTLLLATTAMVSALPQPVAAIPPSAAGPIPTGTISPADFFSRLGLTPTATAPHLAARTMPGPNASWKDWKQFYLYALRGRHTPRDVQTKKRSAAANGDSDTIPTTPEEFFAALGLAPISPSATGSHLAARTMPGPNASWKDWKQFYLYALRGRHTPRSAAVGKSDTVETKEEIENQVVPEGAFSDDEVRMMAILFALEQVEEEEAAAAAKAKETKAVA